MEDSGHDLYAPLYLEDAIPVPVGQVDLRLRFEWVTDDYADVDGDDDFVLGAGFHVGIVEDWQLSLDVPFNVGDGRNKTDAVRGFDGNGDATAGVMWQFADQAEYVPAMALQFKIKFRTGYRHSDLDGEARLMLTNEYDSGLRSHINFFLETERGDWHRLLWGAVIGIDGPMCAGGAVRWVADLAHTNSEHLNGKNSTSLELGFEWEMMENHNLGLTTQFGLDDHDETPDFGARLMYSLELGG